MGLDCLETGALLTFNSENRTLSYECIEMNDGQVRKYQD